MAKRKSGQFSKVCGNKIDGNHDYIVSLSSQAEVDGNTIHGYEWVHKRPGYEALIERGLIKGRKSCCNLCLNYSLKYYVGKCIAEEPTILPSENREIKVIPQIEKVLDSLRTVQEILRGKGWEDLPDILKSELSSFASFMGNLINKSVYDDGLIVGDLFKDLQALKELTIQDFISQRNSIVSAFLGGATGVSPSHENPGKLKALAHLHEQILYTRNLRLVTPFAFQRSLITYSVTGSKTIVTLNGQWESSGSYTSVSNIATTEREPSVCPTGDVINVFDNNQKVGKHSGRIREGSSVPQSVCTAVTHIVPKPDTFLQNDISLHPSRYLKKDTIGDILEKVSHSEKIATEYFRQYRGTYINEKITEVFNEQSANEFGHPYDYVDMAVSSGASKVVCHSCKWVSSDPNDNCPNCKENPNTHDLDYDPYYKTKSMNRNELPNIFIGEPCMVNPSSIAAVQEVVEHISDLAIKDSGERSWTIVASDGVPYVYAANLQDLTVKCDECGLIFKDIEEHTNCSGIAKQFFDSFILIPGPGHIEINMGRAALKLMWEPVLQHIASLLGFRSPNAKRIFKAGIDHHRTRQTLFVLAEALAKELITP